MSCTDNLVEPQSLIAAAIDAAEDIRDLLDGLVERTAADPGAPFALEALERLAALKKENLAGFEALRAQLKKAGCRVTVLDEAIAKDNGKAGGQGPTQADILRLNWSNRPSYSTPRMGPALPISISITTVRHGRSAPRASAAGWPAASSTRRKARRVPRRCNPR
jgi:hypothetical protein